MLNVIEYTLYFLLAAVVFATAFVGTPRCAVITMAGLAAAQGVCLVLKHHF